MFDLVYKKIATSIKYILVVCPFCVENIVIFFIKLVKPR